jgi:hypothetical protein
MMSELVKSIGDIPVNLPKVNYLPSTLIFTLPKNPFAYSVSFTQDTATDKSEFDGASGGVTCNKARERTKNKKIKIPNCD